MFKNSLLAIGAMSAAVGLPYAMSGAGEGQPTTPHPAGSDPNPPPGVYAPADGIQLPPPVMDFGQVIRFDVNPGWVLRCWPQAFGGVTLGEMKGYRAPLITGTQPHDLAGSLTYFFSAEQRVQRLSLLANTADPQRLVQFLTQHYGFKPEKPEQPGEQLFVVRRLGTVTSWLRIRTHAAEDPSQPGMRYTVFMDLQRP